ncbi:DUF3142 domain-containing protein [Metapseudomonas lalkuanensis]|uniref:DUF3142 domain-containing protein n=1 Tax=Metapseudomonas lalkuanensis TaxID=2604832 RepID=A0A5J6QG01_9GAMM|nr:DUF3142 domain-containing protein [Pseudomonas lalkuanensis]QEY61273.1 DUF3142 domain-containing protein [Pseudomonas lalkuanensis]UCO99034.1 DUF3142 domain-containing protein [Pseudomonas lalkuanensis]
MPSSPLRAAFVLLLLMLSGCEQETRAPLDQQLYIWQRQWRPAHAEALAASRADFTTLRVLAAQAHPGAGWSRIQVNSELLATDGRPLVAVVRLDGQLPDLDLQRTRADILALVDHWRAQGLVMQGLEIDHDCASARLPGYRDFLRDLRQALPADLELSITALPAWLDSPALADLLRQVDGSVLQVHAVSAPENGLFDLARALAWAKRWSDASERPFLLALPAYGIALVNGRVESESPLAIAGPRHERQADPQQLAELLANLRRDRPEHLTGVIWFRLPLAGDRRAWRLATLQAVARGESLHADIRPEIQQSGPLHELAVANLGNLDGPLPERIELPARSCEAADALAGYRLERATDRLVFTRLNEGRLAAGQRQALGWARCEHLDQGGSRVYP